MTKRADYCPVGNVPCQSMCETPCNTRKPLSLVRLNECARDAQIDFCMNKAKSFEVAFARRVEEAHGITNKPSAALSGLEHVGKESGQ